MGLIELLVDGDQVSLSLDTVPLSLAEGERLALRIQEVSSLAGLSHPDLADLPLSQLDEPVDLLSGEAGRWAGSLELPSGQVLRITLRRAG